MMASDRTNQSASRRAVRSLAWLTVPLWLGPLACWFAFQPSEVLSHAGIVILHAELLLVVLALVAVAVVASMSWCLLFRKHRVSAAVNIGQAVLFLASFVGGLFLQDLVWKERVTMVAGRGSPLVGAIERYVRDEGRPPDSLADLVPHHIDAIPTTGIGVFPEFRYIAGDPQEHSGNPWVLLALPPSAKGFDSFLYFPLQNYPESGYGGSLERFGAWAYVHE